MLGDVFKSLMTMPCNVLPLHLKQTFPPIILHIHWRWKWWDWIKAILLNLFYFTDCWSGHFCTTSISSTDQKNPHRLGLMRTTKILQYKKLPDCQNLQTEVSWNLVNHTVVSIRQDWTTVHIFRWKNSNGQIDYLLHCVSFDWSLSGSVHSKCGWVKHT